MLTNEQLKTVIEARFQGSLELRGLPIKTRAKRARMMTCEALGYTIPKSFPRTQPRFDIERFDIMVQRSNNYQLWNDDIRLGQRYVFVILDKEERVASVRVVTGLDIANLPQTGTRTTKYQARFRDFAVIEEASTVHGSDTDRFCTYRNANLGGGGRAGTVGVMPGQGLLTISELGAALSKLIGTKLHNPGAMQDRLRGQAVHEAVCGALGYDRYADSGQHPDLPNQLLEVKLQTSPTIDLGLVDPTSAELLPLPYPQALRICDVRYAVFGATNIDDQTTRINNVQLVSGAAFDHIFPRMGGLGQNSKIQIRLPREWFE
jgi:hypothetical protein